MLEIEFSIIQDDPEDTQIITGLLEEFQEQHSVKVNLFPMDWDTAWQDLFSFTLKGRGPDVSHVGSTWSSSLVEMNALRPFAAAEVAEMGGPGAFVAADWESVLRLEDVFVWAIPWYSYLYIVGYRRDLLAQAGIAESSAFETPEKLVDTVQCLKDAGVEIPLALPAFVDPDLMHTAASWVWGSGGGFISDDGKRVLFNHPKSLAGLTTFYSLYRELTPQVSGLAAEDAVGLFSRGQAAILIASSDDIQSLGKGTADPAVLANMGTALPTGIPWFGGGNLVVWRHAREHPEREKAAVALVRYLSSQKVQIRRAEVDATLPARLDALPGLKLKPECLNRTFQQAVKTGQPYRAVPLWRRIEYQLGQELVLIREEVMANPQAKIEEILHRHLDPLARRMDLTLGQ